MKTHPRQDSISTKNRAMPWMIFPALLYFFQPMASFYLFQLNRNIVSITRIEIFDFFQRWIKQRNFPFRFNPQSLSVNKTLHPYMHQNALMKCPLYQNKYSSRQHCIHKELLFTANLNQLGKSKKTRATGCLFLCRLLYGHYWKISSDIFSARQVQE
jgi:hypothetical protein